MRLDDAVRVFLTQWPGEGPRLPSPATVRVYRSGLEWLVDFARRRDKLLLADLTPELLRQAARAKLAEAGHVNWKGGEAAARLVVSASKRMAGWLLAQGMPVHDLSVVRCPRPPERIQPRITPAEFRQLESAVLRRLLAGKPDASITVARDMALINLLSDSGLRAAEVCAMTVDSLSLEQGWVQVHGKGSKERALSIWDPDERDGGATIDLLRRWLDVRSRIPGLGDESSLWVTPRGTPIKDYMLRAVLRGICRAAGVENRPPHAFRRGHFTEAYRAQPETVRLLAARMGWSPKSHQMVDVYTRGADLELTRLQPVPLVSKRWRQSPDRATSVSRRQPLIQMDVGSRGRSDDDAAPAYRGRATGNRAASRTP